MSGDVRPSPPIHHAALRSRVIAHPGPTSPYRIQSRNSPIARHFRLVLEPGATLAEAIIRPLERAGVRSASMTVLGGEFSQLHYCLAPPDATRRSVIAYTRPENLGQALMIFGNATLAIGTDDECIVHCHAAMCSARGVRGGHVVPQLSVVGKSPISVLVTAWSGFELRVRFDEETNIPLIQPC